VIAIAHAFLVARLRPGTLVLPEDERGMDLASDG
jgi:hypothetical protein